ncbi:MAG: VWA domain-containing protein [Phycisphaerales bacterium]|nr:VWA domain-containing protein [Phycisphaerales bacterium]
MNTTLQNLTKLIGLGQPEDHRTRIAADHDEHGGTGVYSETVTRMHEPARRQAPAINELPTWLNIDVSISMGERYSGAKSKIQAAGLAAQSHIVERARGCPDAEIGIITFNHAARVEYPIAPLASARAGMIKTVRSLTTGGGTDMGAAMECARQQLGNRPGRVVLISDGHGGDPVPAAAQIKANGGIVECIGIGSNPGKVDERRLRRAASVIDGQTRYWFVRDLNLLTQTMTMLATNTIQ